MKNFRSFFLLTLFLFTYSCKSPSSPASAAKPERKSDLVVILMLDGMRQANAYAGNKPDLKKLIHDGIAFDGRDTFPSETIVNFTSMATGSYPEKHGITGGRVFFDQEFNQVTIEPKDLKVPSIFEVLEKYGMRGLFMGMKGYDLIIAGKAKKALLIDGVKLEKERPDNFYNHRYDTKTVDSKFADGLSYGWEKEDHKATSSTEIAYGGKLRMVQQAVRKTLSTLREMPAMESVDLIAINLASTDLAGHAWGPHHQNYDRAAKDIAKGVGYFLSQVRQIFPQKKITVMISADHGFSKTTASKRRPLQFDLETKKSPYFNKFFEGISFQAIECGGTCVAFFVKDPAQYRAFFDRLYVERHRKKGWVEKLYTYLDYPEADQKLQAMHDYFPNRTAQFYVDVRFPWALSEPYGHGSAADEDMKIPMIWTGAGIVKSGAISPQVVSIVDIAPTALYLLGIEKPKEWSGHVVGEAVEY